MFQNHSEVIYSYLQILEFSINPLSNADCVDAFSSSASQQKQIQIKGRTRIFGNQLLVAYKVNNLKGLECLILLRSFVEMKTNVFPILPRSGEIGNQLRDSWSNSRH